MGSLEHVALGYRPAHVDSHVRTWQTAGASEPLGAAARMTLASRLSVHRPAAVARATCYGTDAPRHGSCRALRG